MNDYYDLETFEFYVRSKDTVNISLYFKDKDNNDKDITSYNCVFRLLNIIDNEYSDVVKEHDDSHSGGKGIYYNGDTQGWPALNLTADNQIVINFKSEDTDYLGKNIFPFFLILSKIVNGIDTRKTILNGNLIISDEHGDNETFRKVIIDLSAFES